MPRGFGIGSPDPIEWRTSFIKRRPTCQFHGKLKEDPSVRLSAGQAINLGGREEDLVLVSSTLSLTALHSLAPGLIYAPNFTARIKAMRTPLIGSACPLSDGVHQAPLLAPLTDVKMSLQTKKWPN